MNNIRNRYILFFKIFPRNDVNFDKYSNKLIYIVFE